MSQRSRIGDLPNEGRCGRGFRRAQEHQIFLCSRASRKIARRGAKRIPSDRRSLPHADAAVASGLMNSRAGSDERAQTPIVDQHLQHLSRRRIYIEGDAGRDRLTADDFRGDGEVAPSRIGGRADVGLSDLFALDFSHGDDLAGARRFGDEWLELREIDVVVLVIAAAGVRCEFAASLVLFPVIPETPASSRPKERWRWWRRAPRPYWRSHACPSLSGYAAQGHGIR